jgi:hypothetical protein
MASEPDWPLKRRDKFLPLPVTDSGCPVLPTELSWVMNKIKQTQTPWSRGLLEKLIVVNVGKK